MSRLCWVGSHGENSASPSQNYDEVETLFLLIYSISLSLPWNSPSPPNTLEYFNSCIRTAIRNIEDISCVWGAKGRQDDLSGLMIMQRGSGVRIVYYYFVLSCSRGISPVHVRVLGAIVSRYLFNTDISYHLSHIRPLGCDRILRGKLVFITWK